MSHNQTPTSAGRKMSDSLRERLKRSSRYYSPQALKKPCTETTTDSKPSDETLTQEDNKPLQQTFKKQCLAIRTDNKSSDETLKQEENEQTFQDSDMDVTTSKDDNYSQDFEYSDEDCDTAKSPDKLDQHTVKNLQLDIEQISPKKLTRTVTHKIVPKEKLSIPKFERKRVKATIAVEEIGSEVKDAEVDSVTVEKVTAREKVVVPKFKQTGVKAMSNSDSITKCDDNVTKYDDNKTKRDNNIPNCDGTVSKEKKEESDVMDTTDTTVIENTRHEEVVEVKTVTYTNDELNNMTSAQLSSTKRSTQERLAEKEETLRKLKMVKMYRSKNNLAEVGDLVKKWRSVCHDALDELLTATSEHTAAPSIYQLARYFNLDVKLLQLEPDDSQDLG